MTVEELADCTHRNMTEETDPTILDQYGHPVEGLYCEECGFEWWEQNGSLEDAIAAWPDYIRASKSRELDNSTKNRVSDL